MEGKRILVVEDEVEMAKILEMHLRDLGAEVVHCADGNEAAALLENHHWDLGILDIQLPGQSGLELCRAARRKKDYTLIMMLTSRSTEIDRVIGLDSGADDYMTKPFSVMELISRVRALFRRTDHYHAAESTSTSNASQEPLRIKDICIDETSRNVWLDHQPIELTGKEFDLLLYFAKHPDRVFRRTELLDAVWGYGHEGYEHTVNSHINRLRAKIEKDSREPEYIVTVWGVGYKFVKNSTSQG